MERSGRLDWTPAILHQGQTNSCGPCSLAMAANCFHSDRVTPADTARLLRFFRVPFLGATLPWGMAHAGRRLGLDVRARWLGRLPELKASVDRGNPALVVVHPDDFPGMPWYALHYRVLVGYRDDASVSGGGELYFACSAARRDALDADRPGNVAVSYGRFARQWHTYLTIRWYAEVRGRVKE